MEPDISLPCSQKPTTFLTTGIQSTSGEKKLIDVVENKKENKKVSEI
jgi:hypothetical protein